MSANIHARLWRCIAGLVLTSASAAWLLPFITSPASRSADEGFCMLLARLMLRGEVPWNDFFVLTLPPLSAAIVLAGWFQLWGVSLYAGRLAVFAHVLASAWLLWWIGLRWLPLAVTAFGVALFVICGGASTWPDPNPNWFALPWYLLALWALLVWRSSRHLGWGILSALAATAACLYQPSAGLAAIVAIGLTVSGWHLLTPPGRRPALPWRNTMGCYIVIWLIAASALLCAAWRWGMASDVVHSFTGGVLSYAESPLWGWQRPWLLIAVPWLILRSWHTLAGFILLVGLGLLCTSLWIRHKPLAIRVASVLTLWLTLSWSLRWPWIDFSILLGVRLIGLGAVLMLACLMQIQDRPRSTQTDSEDTHLAVIFWAACWLLMITPHWNESSYHLFAWPLAMLLVADLLWRWSRWLCQIRPRLPRRYALIWLMSVWLLPCALLARHGWTHLASERGNMHNEHWLHVPGGGVRFDPQIIDPLLATVREVQERTTPHERVLVLPFEHLISALADRRPPGYNYFLVPLVAPLSPDALSATIQSVLDEPVRLAVTRISGSINPIDAQMPELHPLVDFLERRSEHVTGHGPWRIQTLMAPQLPKSPEAAAKARQLYTKAFDHLHSFNLHKAETLTLQALELDDTLGDAHLLLGQIHTLQLLQDGSLPQGERRTPWAVALHHAGKFLCAAGRRDDGWPLLVEAHTQSPEDVEFLFSLASIASGAGQIESAIQAVNAMIYLRPNDANTHLMRGRLLMRQEHYEEAAQALEWTLKLWPGNPPGIVAELQRARGLAEDGSATAAQQSAPTISPP